MICLWDENPLWHELLKQVGVSFSSGSRVSGRAVIILDREPDVLRAHSIWEHVQSGGCLLAPAANAAAVWPELRLTPGRLRWIAADGDSPLFRNIGIVDLQTRGSRIRTANVGVTDYGGKALLAAPFGRGFGVMLPFRVAAALAGAGSGPKQFPADTPRLPYDTVARPSRGEVRRLIANCLRYLLAQKDLPFVHLPYVPGPGPGALMFRVDTDFGPRRDLEAVARLAERVGMKFSWFVNVGAHGAHLDLFADLARQGHDVQLHCQTHTVYPDYKRNLDNYRQGKDLMAAAGIPPVGVVAPFGEWNPNLNRALEHLGFEYSSEFCLAYDDLPFRPLVAGRLSNVLQVPVHPICLGRLIAARATPKQMASYLCSVIDLQIARQEPCLLYDHPERIARHSDLLADVLQYGNERCGMTTTMTQFARWWRRREQFDWTARYSSKDIDIHASAGRDDLAIVVERDGRSAVLPAGPGKYPLTALPWRALPEPVRFDPRDLAARAPSLLLQARSLHRKARKTLRGHRG